MGKLSEWISTAWLRVGNTIATPVRRTGEVTNALWNVSRQGLSSVKNIKEVQMQSLNAIVDNFLNFSKVKGKRYEKMVKVPVNFVSAFTRRPFMLAGVEVLSTLNQWIREPFKKLLYTPGKMFRWMWNATRIFSKKKGFDFAKYDTHETTWDTRVNQWKEKHIGFFGMWWSPETAPEKKPDDKPKTPSEPETKPGNKPGTDVIVWGKPWDGPVIYNGKENNPEEKKDWWNNNPNRWGKWWWPENKWWWPEAKSQEKINVSTDWKSTPPDKSNKPKSIAEIEKKNKEDSALKETEERKKKNPEFSSLDYKKKAEYARDYERLLWWENPTKEKVIERWKKENLGATIDEIMIKIKEKNPTMAGYVQEEILDKGKATV